MRNTSFWSRLNSEEFLRSVRGKTYRHYPGTPGSLSDVFSWTALNDILRLHRLDSPRLRLAKEGRILPPEVFLKYDVNRRDPYKRIPKLQTALLHRALRNGATLILDAVDELHAPVADLMEDLETVFRVRPQVNLYAGWRTAHGFDIHWDDHDVVIAQIAGRKRWSVYAMTQPHPVARDKVSLRKPESDPLWEGLLNDGDLLYIPRGWWHAAVPLDEPTLHLTIGLSNPNGIDFLKWFVGERKDCENLRRDLPLPGDEAERSEYMQALQKSLYERLTTETLGEYLAYRDERSRPRPHPALPWAATPAGLPAGDQGWSVRWIAPREIPIRSEHDDSAISFKCHGKKFRFAGNARSLIEGLMMRREFCFDEICALVPGASRAAVRNTIREMLDEELITIGQSA
ncbi:MAG: cupin [Bryobacteraceae bacterium]|nr:cupin [Bryobacteraceae bacterium]